MCDRKDRVRERRERGDSQNRDSARQACCEGLDHPGVRDTGGPSDRAGRRQAQGTTTAQEPPQAKPCMADRERVARGMQQRGCMGFHDGVRGSKGEDEGGRCPGHALVCMGRAGAGPARIDPSIV